MFQSYKYGFLNLLRDKSMMFYSLLFPIILGTFFSFAFGGIIKNTENFSSISVAVVANNGNRQAEQFLLLTDSLSEGEDALISPQYVDMVQAQRLLEQDEVAGIFLAEDKISLIVSKNGLSQNILKMITDSYLQISNTISNIAVKRPDIIQQTVDNISKEIDVNREIALGKGETDTFIHYYYSLLAMACLFGSSFGSKKVMGIQANLSPLAARRCISPSKKITMIIGDVAAAVTLLFVMILIVIAYLIYVLGINFGEQWGFVVLTCFVGSVVGVSFGTFISSIVKAGKATVEGILTGSSLVLCFLSGLMVGNMKNIIENSVPVINRINPATLLADAFYCLSVYDDYSRYTRNIASLVIISIIFCVVSAIVLRRKQYACI